MGREGKERRYRVNYQIRSPKVRVIDEGGNQLGILDIKDALNIAKEKNLDLVEIVPDSNLPVCRILDFKRFLYEQKKKEKEIKKKQKILQTKEIRFTPETSEHDYKFKKQHIENFLKDAQKILIIISSTPFNPLYNQRPLNISKEFVKNGYSVLFVTWQWSREDVVASSYEEICKGIMPLPLYDFLDLYNIFHFPAKEKIYYLSFPVKEFLSTIRILRARGFKILYDIMDDWEGFYEVNQAPWYDKTVEEAILLEADYIIAINLYLLEKFSHLRKDIVLVGNAYNSEILGIDAKFIGGSRVREKFKAGYYGWLDESVFDWEYIFEIARSYPEIDIELIGYGLSESIQRKIEKYSNIKYLGKIYPSELKNYVATWNVAMIPFREKAISKGSDPLKVYEYINFGIPVAVKGIEAIKDYPLVFYLNSKKDFKVLIEKFDTREKIIAFRETQRERIEKFLSESTWEARVKRILEVIKEETFWT
ncbi:MAG: translation initiation factor IF-3 [Candidatus Ratteibacteria bacterium]